MACWLQWLHCRLPVKLHACAINCSSLTWRCIWGLHNPNSLLWWVSKIACDKEECHGKLQISGYDGIFHICLIVRNISLSLKHFVKFLVSAEFAETSFDTFLLLSLKPFILLVIMQPSCVHYAFLMSNDVHLYHPIRICLLIHSHVFLAITHVFTEKRRGALLFDVCFVSRRCKYSSQHWTPKYIMQNQEQYGCM